MKFHKNNDYFASLTSGVDSVITKLCGHRRFPWQLIVIDLVDQENDECLKFQEKTLRKTNGKVMERVIDTRRRSSLCLPSSLSKLEMTAAVTLVEATD